MATHRLLKLVRDLSFAHRTREVLELSIDAAMEISGTDSGRVWLEEEAGGIWEPVCRRGSSGTDSEDVPARLLKSLQMGLLAAPDLNEVLDGAKAPGFDEWMKQSGAATWGAVPLKRNRVTTGCLLVSSGTNKSISQTARQSLQIIGWQTGCALTRVKAEEELNGREQAHRSAPDAQTELQCQYLPGGIVMTSRDVAERRHIEQMKSDFVTTAAHHLRTPLTSILGFSELLLIKDNLTTEERAKYLEYIRDNAKSMSDIINDLLDIARIESGEGMPLRPQMLDLREIVEETTASFRESSSAHRIQSAPPTDPIEVFADKYRMTRLFRNLLDNAYKYSPAGGLIKVTCDSFPEYHLFVVSDEGVGMNPKQAKRVFDPFYRVDASDTAETGTGLGLTVARNIVEAQGGRIWVESGKDRGTEVKFTLPKRPPTDGGEGSDYEEDSRCG
ncbi:MAG: HAMP domain-containing sensor histidine kinase [Pseudomonadota bacterium]